MSENPVWRESMEIYFVEGHGFAVYFYLLIILAPVEFLSLYIPSLDAQMWSGSASLFKVDGGDDFAADGLFFPARGQSGVRALALQIAQDLAARRRPARAAVIRRAQLGFLCVHIGLSLLLCGPLLVWAGAIARTPLSSIALTFLLLPFYALIYGVWGLATLALWERRLENRQVFIRCLFAALVILSALFYLPLNPIAFLLAILSRQELAPLALFGWQWPGTFSHLSFHLLLGAAGYARASLGA